VLLALLASVNLRWFSKGADKDGAPFDCEASGNGGPLQFMGGFWAGGAAAQHGVLDVTLTVRVGAAAAARRCGGPQGRCGEEPGQSGSAVPGQCRECDAWPANARGVTRPTARPGRG
jgi:hypothetical protein